MNQSTQVLDGALFENHKQALKVEFIFNGQLCNCYVKGISEADSVAFYLANKFSIEDLIEEAGLPNELNERGELWLSHTDIV